MRYFGECFAYARAFLKGSAVLEKLIERETQESIDLRNGISIEISAASFKSVRGYSVVAALLDEAAFFQSDDTSAVPDAEIVHALLPGLATTSGMLLVASSPYRKKGILWTARQRHWGVNDSKVLVWQAPSTAMNPLISQEIVDAAIARDASVASSEWLAEFRADLEDFVPREAVLDCVTEGVRERAPVPTFRYVAFADPAGGGQDSFALAIAHAEGETVVIDAVRERAAPVSPNAVISEFADLLKKYGCNEITTDRYAAQFNVEAWQRCGITCRHSELTASGLYAELLPLINSKALRLLENDRAVNQLCSLERRTGRSGRDHISHPPGHHDDLSNVIAGAAFLAGVSPVQASGVSGIGYVAGGSGPIEWSAEPVRRSRFNIKPLTEEQRESQRRENALFAERNSRGGSNYR